MRTLIAEYNMISESLATGQGGDSESRAALTLRLLALELTIFGVQAPAVSVAPAPLPVLVGTPVVQAPESEWDDVAFRASVAAQADETSWLPIVKRLPIVTLASVRAMFPTVREPAEELTIEGLTITPAPPSDLAFAVANLLNHAMTTWTPTDVARLGLVEHNGSMLVN